MTEHSTQERVNPNADGSAGGEVERWRDKLKQVKTLAPQLDFTSVDFCPVEQIKFINKLLLLPRIPFNTEKLEERVINCANKFWYRSSCS